MGRDAVRTRHVSDQSDCLQDAVRSGERRIRGLRRILHRHPIAARRIISALAIVMPGWKSDAMTRAHSQSCAKRTRALECISHEVLWSAGRLRTAFATKA